MVPAFGTAFLMVIPLTVGLLLCGWVVWRIIGMGLLREISGLETVILVGMFIGLALSAIAARGAAAFLLLVLLWMAGMMYPVLLALADWRKARIMARDDIAGYLRALETQPDVPYPHRKLGDIYRGRGNWDQAIEHYQEYLEVHPDAGQIKFRLEKALTARRREALGLRVCPACAAENVGDAARCEQCGFYLKGAQEIVSVLSTPEMMRIWRWLVVIFIVPGVVLSLLSGAPAAFGVALVAGAVGATGLLLYGGLIRPKGEPS